MTTDTTSTLKVKVAARRNEAKDIVSFELVAPDGRVLPAFAAGAHVDVKLGDGIVRPYSLCNDPAEDHRYLIAVLKDAASRGGSRAMHERVGVGHELEISAPKNHFRLAHEAARSLLLAGGIGVTPILCMAEHLSARGAEFEMHYCTRSAELTAFRARIESSAFASRVHFHFDDGEPVQRLDLAALLQTRRAGDHLYVCGPKGFMDAVLNEARAQGWPEAQLHCEFFGAGPVHGDGDQAFEVLIASTGRVVSVLEDQTVAKALSQAGVEIATSCEQGLCGTCVTRVLDGVPDHRDLFLTAEEQAANDRFTPCCSRAKTARLVLDL